MQTSLPDLLPIPAELLLRVRSEFGEMPDLHLTCAEASRLLGLEHDVCGAVLRQLAGDGFLRRDTRGHYVRARH